MKNGGKLNFIMNSWMQFNTIVLSGLCALKTVPSATTFYFNVPIQQWWPVVSLAHGCQQGPVLAEPCSMSGRMHFGIAGCGRASAAFPSPGSAGKTLMWRTIGELQSGDYFLKTMQTPRHECHCSDAPVRSLRRGSLGSRIMAQPARPPSQAPGNHPRKRWDVLFWALNCSVPASAWPSPPYPPPATPQQGELKDRPEEFVPPALSPLPCAVTTSPSWSHQRRWHLHVQYSPAMKNIKTPTPLGD